MDCCGQKVHLHKDLLEVKIEMSCRSCSRSFWSVCMLYVKEEEDKYYLADDDRVAEGSHILQPGSQSLLVAAAGVAALLQWARPGPTACGEQPLFLLAGWVESACGDVLGASGQDIVSRAVYSEAEVWKKKSISPCSPSCTHKELFFFKMLNTFSINRFLVCVPLGGDCGWQTWGQLWFSCGTIPAVQAVAARTLLKFIVGICSC